MYKPTGNAQVLLLQKTWTERSYNLSNLQAIKVEVPGQEKPKRMCAWCAENELWHGNQKYCSESCGQSAMAWAYPQKEQGLGALLLRQEYKCNVCKLDWMPYVDQVLNAMRRPGSTILIPNPKDGLIWYLIKRIKARCPLKERPEVDHIIPVSKGGQSIGLDNHQAICAMCHKAKTKIDNSGPRKKPLT